MALHHRCAHGDLTALSGVWRTQNFLKFSFPSAPFGCCVSHRKEVTNCYLYSTEVHVRHGELSPQAAVGDLSACSYADGSCTLADGSLLIWTPDTEEACEYIFVSRLTGYRSDTIWVSDDKEFALSWPNQSTTFWDCAKELTLTDQGYAVAISRRQPRGVSEDVGMVTSNQLAAQLLAVEGATYSSVSVFYRNALRLLCDRTSMLSSAFHAALLTQPTITMRLLLDREDISASYLGNGHVQVQRCVALSPVELIAFNTTCYSLPRVQIRLPSGSLLRAFMEPATGIIRRQASPLSCSDVSPIILHT
ncbi:hypothetical protein V3C99_000032, partial [Haemonchus contortus]